MNNRLNEPLCNYRAHQPLDNGCRIFLENGVADVCIWAEGVCRVHIGRTEKALNRGAYAVCGSPGETAFSVKDTRRRLTLQTSTLRVEMTKNPFRIRFYTPSDVLLNADDPAFGTSWIGDEVTTYKTLQPGERFVGMGEKTGNLDRAGSACVNWNTDWFAYTVDADPLYVSIPFYIGIQGGHLYGIFLDNTHKTRFNFGASNNRFASFSAESGTMDYYFIHADDVAGIIRQYTELTGRMPLPPLWSLGYQQSRYSYYPDHEVLAVAESFRQKDIPADVIYLDIHYMDGFKVFTWDSHRFPDPPRLLRDLAERGFHTAVILDPGIKVEKGYPVYDAGRKADVFVKYPDGEDYAAEVWPGLCHFPDFTRPETREWWGGLLWDIVETGVSGFWNDMNEPSAWGQNIPDLIEFDGDGEKMTYKAAHNIYGMQMARSTYEGVKEWMERRRPFVLTRSGFAGLQRYSAVWTGDNRAEDDHMLCGVRLVNSLGLSGVGFAGFDTGGFAGEPSAALFARWVSLGAFSPLFRGHSMVDSRSAEPWSFGETAEMTARNYIKLRYRLLPYIYSAFYETSRTGMPVARSLVIPYPHDPLIYAPDYQNQYLFGPWLLVAPVRSDQSIARVYLPPGQWYDLYSDCTTSGPAEIYAEAPLDRLPVFARAGAIIPIQEPCAHTGEPPDGPLAFHFYLGGNQSTYVYYEDDGVTDACKSGDFYERTVTMERDTITFGPVAGQFTSRFSEMALVFHGFPLEPGDTVSVNDATVALENAAFCLVPANEPASGATAIQPLNHRWEFPQMIIANHAGEIRIRLPRLS
ncbi:MAG: glycoside hydrolase family 31 protein [Thermodesulfobacteriota bacterium]|nr:glycoside hydrolase family 31 protein [Thermodesulfobacteriota bacterium]